MEWQPIETAPKDETPILAYLPEGGGEVREYTGGPGTAVMWWSNAKWIGYYDGQLPLGQPTHWMPLPPPPGTACGGDANANRIDEAPPYTLLTGAYHYGGDPGHASPPPSKR